MTARVTMRDVAQAAGVSPMTVSRTFKRDGSVNADTRRLVRETADRLGYVYDGTAQAFRAQRSGFVAVTLPSINNANFAATHRALTRQLSDTGLQILLGITGYGLEEEERLVRQLLARRPEAIVMTGGTHTDDTRAMIRALKAPTIEIWDLPVEPLGHVVGFSNADAMAKIVTHLAETGRTRLAFIGATGDSDHRGAAPARRGRTRARAWLARDRSDRGRRRSCVDVRWGGCGQASWRWGQGVRCAGLRVRSRGFRRHVAVRPDGDGRAR